MNNAHWRIESANVAQFLTRNFLFAASGSGLIAQLAHHSRWKSVRKGGAIYYPGDLAKELYIVATGLVKRVALSATGTERVIDLLHGGQCVGDVELFGEQCYNSIAMAVDDSLLVCLDGEEVRTAMGKCPQLCNRIVSLMAEKRFQLEGELMANALKSGMQRTLDYLRQQKRECVPYTEDIEIQLVASKQLIASRLGLTPETFSRTLRELSDLGVITVNGRSIRLHNEHRAVSPMQQILVKDAIKPRQHPRRARDVPRPPSDDARRAARSRMGFDIARG